MEERLEQEDIRWLMERQVDSYLVWIGLWLVCLLGNASVLTTMVSNNTLSIAKLSVISIVYIGLVLGMVFSVYRLSNIISDHILLARQIENNALRDYIINSRGRLAKIAVNNEGNICTLNLVCLIVFHFVVFLSLFYFALF